MDRHPGASVSLARHVVSGSGYEVEFLCLAEIDDQGRGTFNAVFESDALDAAIAELEQRYLAGEAAAVPRE